MPAPPSASLAEQLFRVTVRVCTDKKVATAFLFETARRTRFLVTNTHVIRDAESVTCLLALESNHSPGGFEYRMAPTAWHPHPDPRADVAVAPLDPIVHDIGKYGHRLANRPVPAVWTPSGHLHDEIDAIEEILFVGYPKGYYDSANNYPIARRGITATPIKLDYNGSPAFLIDAEVFPGSSGSPVFLYNAGAYTNRFGGTVAGRRCLFLGIISEYFPFDTAQILGPGDFRHSLGLGLVHKPTVIENCIMDYLQTPAP